MWADHDRVSPRTGWLLGTGSLVVLVALTSAGVYPVAMLGIPGAGVTNMTPPTFAMFILGTMQLGVVWGTQPAVRRFTARAGGWHFVVALSGVIMTIYLWHLSAMSLLAAAGLFAFDGALFRIEPASALWWLTRPVWLAILSAGTLALTAVFARFEWRINRRPAPQHATTVVVGLGLIGVATAMVALNGIADSEASVDWLIPLLATAGALLVGVIPTRRRGHDELRLPAQHNAQ